MNKEDPMTGVMSKKAFGAALGKMAERTSAQKPGVTTIWMTVGPPVPGYRSRDLTYSPTRLYLKPGKDSVQWALSGGGSFRIEFAPGDSPFEKDIYTDKDKAAVVRPDARENYPFHYNLVSANRLRFAVYARCPEIIIQR
jgi:hypothetical protein